MTRRTPTSPSSSRSACASKFRCTSATPAFPTASFTRAPTGRPETVEEAARNLRYDLFRQLIAEGHADSILTAHTLDDQAETVLMKLLRGAWTEGLSGIHPTVIVPSATRPGPELTNLGPLLAESSGRSRVAGYLESRNQGWRTDSTNADDAFTRNRIRHCVLPLLREFNPAIDQALANLAELAREDEARWQTELSRILPQLMLPGRPVRGGGRAVSTAPGESGAGSVSLEIDRLRRSIPRFAAAWCALPHASSARASASTRLRGCWRWPASCQTQPRRPPCRRAPRLQPPSVGAVARRALCARASPLPRDAAKGPEEQRTTVTILGRAFARSVGNAAKWLREALRTPRSNQIGTGLGWIPSGLLPFLCIIAARSE